MNYKRLTVKASRWPWQVTKDQFKAPLNPSGSRFGGGWDYKLGVAIGSSKDHLTISMDLLWGIVTINYKRKAR